MLSVSSKRKREQPGNHTSRIHLPLTGRVWLALFTAAFLSLCLASNLQPQRFSLKIGQVVPRDIRAPITASFTEPGLQRPDPGRPVDQVIRTLARDERAALDAMDGLTAAIGRIQAVRASQASASVHLAELQKLLHGVPAPTLRSLANASASDFETMARTATAVLSLELAQRPVTRAVGDLDLARGDLLTRARSMAPRGSLATGAAALAGAFLRPDVIELTAPSTSRGLAVDDAPVYTTVHRGDLLARKGDLVGQRLLDQLDSLGLNGPEYGLLWRLCLVALSIGSLVVVALFIRLYYPSLYADTRRMALLSFIVLSGVAALRFLGFALGLRLTSSQYGFFTLMWVAAVGMLIATLIRAEVAVLVAALLSLHTAIILHSQLQYGIAAFFSALAAIFSVRRIRRRSHVLRSMGVIAAVNLLSVWVLTIWNAGLGVTELKLDLGIASAWALFAGVMAPILFFIGAAGLEHLFGITTDLTLLELCDNHQPLLRRLILEAPGTYAHSVGVASLAEAAAEAIGAQTLWVRAGALYHDVGKIGRPYFFIENQQGENLHNKLSPTMSAKVITAHITDGIELAREHHLPEVILDYIRQHHGTSLISYFYHQAIISSDTPSGIAESAFRYAGPRPQTREAGILMLADTVESVIRSTARKNPGRIEAIVARAVQGKVADGQLTECDLTFREIDQIQSAFTRVLGAIYHSRIPYPAADAPEERWLAGAGSGR